MDKELDRKLKEFVHRSLDIIPSDEIFLYGSYAKGNPSADSDIDIAVIIDKFSGDYLKKSSELFSIVADIDYRIEPVLLIKSNDKPGFINHIKSYGQMLYSRT